MKVRFDKTFERDLGKLNDLRLKSAVVGVIEQVEKSESLLTVRNLKQLRGFKNCFRIRIGDYRIGIYSDGRQVDFIRFGHRRDFYRFFPRR